MFLLLADLPEDAAIRPGTKVCFDIVPGMKEGQTKAGNLWVPPQGAAPTGCGPQGGPAATRPVMVLQASVGAELHSK